MREIEGDESRENGRKANKIIHMASALWEVTSKLGEYQNRGEWASEKRDISDGRKKSEIIL